MKSLKTILIITILFCCTTFVVSKAATPSNYLSFINFKVSHLGNGGARSDTYYKEENSLQYLMNGSDFNITAVVCGYTTNGQGPYEDINSRWETVQSKKWEALGDFNNALSIGVGKGETHVHLRYNTPTILVKYFNGTWIPDKSFYDYYINK